MWSFENSESKTCTGNNPACLKKHPPISSRKRLHSLPLLPFKNLYWKLPLDCVVSSFFVSKNLDWVINSKAMGPSQVLSPGGFHAGPGGDEARRDEDEVLREAYGHYMSFWSQIALISSLSCFVFRVFDLLWIYVSNYVFSFGFFQHAIVVTHWRSWLLCVVAWSSATPCRVEASVWEPCSTSARSQIWHSSVAKELVRYESQGFFLEP